MVPPIFPPIPTPTFAAPVFPVPSPQSVEIATPLANENIAAAIIPPVNPKVSSTQALPPMITESGRIKFAIGSAVRIPNPKMKTSPLPTAPIKIVIPVVPHPGAPVWTKTIEVQPGITGTFFGVTPTATVQGILPRHGGSDRESPISFPRRDLC